MSRISGVLYGIRVGTVAATVASERFPRTPVEEFGTDRRPILATRIRSTFLRALRATPEGWTGSQAGGGAVGAVVEEGFLDPDLDGDRPESRRFPWIGPTLDPCVDPVATALRTGGSRGNSAIRERRGHRERHQGPMRESEHNAEGAMRGGRFDEIRARIAAVAAVCAAAGLVAIGIGTGQGALSAQSVQPNAPAPVAKTADRVALAPPPADAAGDDAAAPGPAQGLEVETAAPSALTSEHRIFNGRPIRPVRVHPMRVTAYSPDERSCGASADGITASGYSVATNGGELVAADPSLLPLGSLVSVPGYAGGAVVPVLDVGGAIKGKRLDVLFESHGRAREWGVQDLEVTVWEYADGLPNDFRRLRRPSKRG
jgi:3D (Asp-Asp-Asp) domain-containing protein